MSRPVGWSTHAVIPRFYAPAADPGASRVDLSADESHHLRHVLRLAREARVKVFDGRGREWNARVGNAGGRHVIVELEDEVQAVPEPVAQVTLALSVLKTDVMDDAIRDAAMIGVHAVQPIVSERSAPRPPSAAVRLVARWQRIVVASVKQCGRATVPEVHAPEALTSWLAGPTARSGVRLLLVEPSHAPAAGCDPLGWFESARAGGAAVLVGPEGGWARGEVERAIAGGCVPWCISRRVLRADAVAVAALSILYYAWEHTSQAGMSVRGSISGGQGG